MTTTDHRLARPGPARANTDRPAPRDGRAPALGPRLARAPGRALAAAAPLLLAACGGALPGGSGVADAVTTPSPDGAVISPGTALPYGEIATVCDLPADTGTPVATQSGLTLRDTDPTTVNPRTHYLTGLPDGCARQFTAALALFGDVGTHEVVRYQPSNADIPFTETDTAYEEIKAAFCGAPAGQPCGARLEALGAITTFVTVYETFGTNPSWADILIHDGAVVAMDFKND